MRKTSDKPKLRHIYTKPNQHSLKLRTPQKQAKSEKLTHQRGLRRQDDKGCEGKASET